MDQIQILICVWIILIILIIWINKIIFILIIIVIVSINKNIMDLVVGNLLDNFIKAHEKEKQNKETKGKKQKK